MSYAIKLCVNFVRLFKLIRHLRYPYQATHGKCVAKVMVLTPLVYPSFFVSSIFHHTKFLVCSIVSLTHENGAGDRFWGGHFVLKTALIAEPAALWMFVFSSYVKHGLVYEIKAYHKDYVEVSVCIWTCPPSQPWIDS